MKVLFANKFFFLNGGSETVFFQERDFLLTSGVDVVDFSMADVRNLNSPYAENFVGGRQYKTGGGVLQKLDAGISLIHSSEAVRNISLLIKKTQPDLLHCHNIYHQLTPSIIGAAKKNGIPVVLTLHDYKPVCPSYVRIRNGEPCSECLGGDFFNVVRHRCADGSLGKSALLYTEAVVQRLLGNYELVDKVIAPSRFMADSVAGRFAKNRVDVIYNGIDVSAMTPSSEEEGYLLFLGRISKEKGLGTLLAVYRQGGMAMPLKVCGTGPLLEEFSSERLPGVEFLGYQSGTALQDIIRKASVICVPSEWYENCPMSVLEAMAYGKPVIGSRIGGIPELVDDGVTGLLHEPGDVESLRRCIHSLVSDADMRKQMGMAARRRVEERFSLAKHNESLLGIYKQLVS